jgi:hypothetical protein
MRAEAGGQRTVSGRLAAVVLVAATLAAQTRTLPPSQDDLFTWANADWLASTRIPDDRVSYGTFAEIVDRTEIQLRAIVEDVIAGRARVSGATRQQVTALYTSATDESRPAMPCIAARSGGSGTGKFAVATWTYGSTPLAWRAPRYRPFSFASASRNSFSPLSM